MNHCPGSLLTHLFSSGTSGLGWETVLALSKHHPAHILFTGRNASAASTLVKDLEQSAPDTKVTFIECDFTSLSSVAAAAQKFTGTVDRLDILYCNAGVAAVPPGLTKDGYEIHFGVNHVAHALLIKLLLPTLLKTASSTPKSSDVRIIVVTSRAFGFTPPGGIRFPDLKTTEGGTTQYLAPWARYGQSKLANLLYARELSRRYPSLTVIAVHPGTVQSPMVMTLGWADLVVVYLTGFEWFVTAAVGAATQLWAGTAAKDAKDKGGRSGPRSGELYYPVGKVGPKTKDSEDPGLASELWRWTEKALEAYK